jgi:carbonic anhydrase/acetyltransferase-like protein (isoleucine patch superfamily)
MIPVHDPPGACLVMQLLYIRSFSVYPTMIEDTAKIPDATILHAGTVVKTCFVKQPAQKLKRASGI